MIHKYHMTNCIDTATPLAAFAVLSERKGQQLFTFSQDIFIDPNYS
jgi:hypothetical protein